MSTPALSVPRCANCNHRIEGTPWAFPLSDLRFDAWVRFCTEPCLRGYEAKETKATAKLGREHVDVDGFFFCEFCRCHTNAHARACCNAGRDADRNASKARSTHRVGEEKAR